MAALRISGRGMDLGDALRTRVEERISAALAKYFTGSYSGHVTVARDGTAYRTDCVLHLASGATLEASGAAHDPTASFDQTAERIEKRLRRYKRRLKDRPSGAQDGAASVEAAYAILDAPAETDDALDDEAFEGGSQGESHPPVVAETRKPVHRRSVSEAVADLDLTDAPVVVFVHAGSGRINVVYRRRDGAVGWIDPPERRAP